MRICVVHIISLIILLIPIILHTYYLWKNCVEKDEALKSLLPNREVLQSRVHKSISAHSKEIDSIRYSLAKKENSERFSCTQNTCDKCTSSPRCINYADEQLGAKIKSVKADKLHQSAFFNIEEPKNPPVNLLRSNMRPGNCFAYKSRQAEIEIQLSKVVYIDLLEIEHIPKSRSPTKDTSSAPREFRVYGIQETTGNRIFLGKFEFLNKSPCQKFKLSVGYKFRTLIFIFESNHGNPKHTCIYRIGIYGSA